MDNSIKQAIAKAGWIFSNSVWDCLSDYEKGFVLNEFTAQRSVDYYIRRLKYIGFTGMERVLDAGCGMGQWTLALSYLNKNVIGIDLNTGRLLIARALSNNLGRTNCSFRYSSLEKMTYEPESFDGIFCYGVFMFTHIPKSLSEFRRVLKPGGKLYLNANSTGWCAHLLFDRGIKKKDLSMVKTALRMIARTFMGKKSNIVVRKEWLKKQIKLCDLEIVAIGLEGELGLNKDNDREKPAPAYPKHFYGMPAILEVLAQKRCQE